MDTMDAIHARRSYRGQYSDARVPREDLTAIMKAGLAAPSGCNMQTVSLVAVDDREQLERLRGVMGPCPGKTAPALIFVLTSRIIAYGNQCFSIQDYSAAIENMLLAVVALGYQSCWVEGYVTGDGLIGQKMARILGVKDGYELVCCLPVGKALEPYGAPTKKPVCQRAWFNRFGSDAMAS